MAQILWYNTLMVSLSGPQGTKAYLDNQAAKSSIEAAKYAAAGNTSKAIEASNTAAQANLASAQMSQQIIESNK